MDEKKELVKQSRKLRDNTKQARSFDDSVKDKSEYQYTTKVVDSGVQTFQNRLLVGTPTTGSVRMEWASARYGQAIPANWSKVDMIQYMSAFVPMRYSIMDAQNLIVQEAITKNYEWLLLIEDDTCPPPDGFIRFNEYIRSGKYPVVSGLYYTKSDPSEPMIYRGRGNSYYTNWKLGDRIWVDGVPTGMVLISVKLLKAVWNDSPEYMAGEYRIRRVFENPIKTWFNEEKGSQEALVGTTDLDFCKRIINEGYLAKAGWPDLQKLKYPLLIDTRINCIQVAPDGVQYPVGGIPHWCGVNGNWPEGGKVKVGTTPPKFPTE